MRIIFNNQIMETSSVNLQDVICEILNDDVPKGIAVAVNKKIIRKNEYQEYILNENDEILVITATAGG